MNIELKPCPFCGSYNIDYWFDIRNTPAGVRCDDCKAVVGFSRAKNARDLIAEAWNRRKK